MSGILHDAFGEPIYFYLIILNDVVFIEILSHAILDVLLYTAEVS